MTTVGPAPLTTAPPAPPAPVRAPRVPDVVATFVRLRWRLLRGAIRRGGADQAGAIVSTVASAIIGLGAGVALAVGGRTIDARSDFAVLACSLIVLGVVGFGIVAGVAQPVDPRVVAPEPLDDRRRAIGVLAAAAFGPPGLAAIAIGGGLLIGMSHAADDVPIVLLGVGSWLLSLLLVARTATNLLALLLNRFPRAGQLVVGCVGIVFYGSFQLIPALLGELDDGQRSRIADLVAWSPPGQLGRAVGDGGDVPTALLHLTLGSIWLPVLAIAFERSEQRLATSIRHHGGVGSMADLTGIRRLARLLCGAGVAGAIAWRSLLLRFRSPRTALETVTGAAIGFAAVLAPAVLRDDPGAGAVLVGGAVQLAVLFMSGNSFGSDGPGLTHELMTGVDVDDFVAGKLRSIMIVAAPLAVVGPFVAAGLTGEWRYLPAGCCVGAAGLLAGSGAAVVQSAMVPIAVPESDNPFASGETGKGVVAALLLMSVLTALAIATIPIALALFWASDRGRVDLVTAFAVVTVLVGWSLARLGRWLAVRRISTHQPEFLAAVTPTR
jgi:ABC-2 type transport system permease protein